MYIKFRDNSPEYGFICEGDEIKSFINLTDNIPDIIVLPYINQNAFVPECQEQMDVAKRWGFGKGFIKGNIRIAPNCFKGFKKANICMPFNSSVMLDWGCFDDESERDDEHVLGEGR